MGPLYFALVVSFFSFFFPRLFSAVGEWLVTAPTSLKLCTMFDRLMDWYTIYAFRALSP